MVFVNIKLRVLNFLILSRKVFEKANFYKSLRVRHFLLGGRTNITFSLFLDT